MLGWQAFHTRKASFHWCIAGFFGFPLGHLKLVPRAKQLQQIVGKAYQLPFGSDLLQSTEREAPEAAPLLNLSEHWLDDCLAHPVNIPSGIAVELLCQVG
jgi:hypothetical protein